MNQNDQPAKNRSGLSINSYSREPEVRSRPPVRSNGESEQGRQTGCVVRKAAKRSWMETKPTTWQERFGLTTCPAQEIDQAISPSAPGVAVIYTQTEAGEKIILVLESRAGGLRNQCEKRLQSGKLPPTEQLTVAFKCELLSDTSAEAVHAACREQVIFAGEIRRELRPAMR